MSGNGNPKCRLTEGENLSMFDFISNCSLLNQSAVKLQWKYIKHIFVVFIWTSSQCRTVVKISINEGHKSQALPVEHGAKTCRASVFVRSCDIFGDSEAVGGRLYVCPGLLWPWLSKRFKIGLTDKSRRQLSVQFFLSHCKLPQNERFCRFLLGVFQAATRGLFLLAATWF